MTDRLPIEPPSSNTAHFLVAVPDMMVDAGPLDDLVSSLGGAGPLAATARELFETSRLVVDAGPAATSGWHDRLCGVAGPGDETARLPGAVQHIVVTSAGPPAAGPREAQAARLVARSIAARTAGVVVDATANQALSGGDPSDAPRGEAEIFVLGDEWLAVFVGYDHDAVTTGRVRVETAGLRRFALPELTTRDVPLGRMLTAVNIVRALAYRLLREYWVWLSAHPGQTVWWIERERFAAARDVWRYWGARPVGDGGVWVRLSPRGCGPPDRLARLEITPAGATPGDDWWAAEASPAIPLLTSAPSAEPAPPPDMLAARRAGPPRLRGRRV
jgi:hypothetical protein